MKARTSVGADGASTSGWGHLDAIVAQLRVAGIDAKVDPEDYPNERFAQLEDPGENAIQLWEPTRS